MCVCAVPCTVPMAAAVFSSKKSVPPQTGRPVVVDSIVALTVFAEDDDKAVIYGLLVEERMKRRASKMDGREMI